MICTNCGKEIGDTLMQCPECGMPTKNVPVVKAPNSKKKKKKKSDKPLVNIPAILSIPVSLLGVLNSVMVVVPSVMGWLVWYLWFDDLTTTVSIPAIISYIIISLTFVYLLSVVPYSIISIVLTASSMKNKKFSQRVPIISLCFTVFAVITLLCMVAIFFAWCLWPYIDITIYFANL